MFTRTHETHPVSIQKAVYNQLYQMMVAICAKKGIFLTQKVKQAIHETAEADIRRMMADNTLNTYYQRMKAGQI